MIERRLYYYYLFISCFWVIATLGFVTQELIPFADKIGSYVFFLSDLVLIWLGIITCRKRGDIIVILSFLIISIISTFGYNHESILIYINGLREFAGLLFIVPIIRYFFKQQNRDWFITRFDKQLKIFLWVQAFCIVWQFIKYGANDHGGGSMGNGFSGIVTTLIYIISFYLISKRWDSSNYLLSLKNNKLLIVLLFPTFLNETKISFIFLIVYFFLLLKFDWNIVIKLIITAPLSIIGICVAGYAYMVVTSADSSVFELKTYTDTYLAASDKDEAANLAYAIYSGEIVIGNNDVWDYDIPRFTKIALMDEALENTGGKLLWGAGIGQLKGGNVAERTKFALTNDWLLAGSRPWIFFVVIQLGIVGLVWFILEMLYLFNFSAANNKLGLKIKLMLLATVVMIMFYNDSFRSMILCIPFIFILLYSSIKCESVNLKTNGEC